LHTTAAVIDDHQQDLLTYDTGCFENVKPHDNERTSSTTGCAAFSNGLMESGAGPALEVTITMTVEFLASSIDDHGSLN